MLILYHEIGVGKREVVEVKQKHRAFGTVFLLINYLKKFLVFPKVLFVDRFFYNLLHLTLL